MGFHNPDIPWHELERRLSGHVPGKPGKGTDGWGTGVPDAPLIVDPIVADADGGDAPAWGRKRLPYRAEPIAPPPNAVPYAELHCHTNFSFLDGASHPEELAEEAARLGLTALAVTDHDGMYGVVRFSQAARQHGLSTVFGAELSLELPGPQNGEPDPAGRHLLLLARGPDGYAKLSSAISMAHFSGGEKGRPVYNPEMLGAALLGHVQVLTGCRKGAVPAALVRDGMAAARAELGRLVYLFGADSVAVEVSHHGLPDDDDRNDALAALAREKRLPIVATNNVHYATPAQRKLATALAAVRARRSLDEIDGWLPAAAGAHLRSGAEMTERFAAYPGAVEYAAALGRSLAFDLDLLAPSLPPYRGLGPGHDEMSWLRKLTHEGAGRRYGPPQRRPDAYRQLEHELALIEEMGFAGYFLVVYDIVKFCKDEDIYCQGRGSAANSAVCYALGITNVDSVKHALLFERFLSPERDGPPDIDVDIESDRREEAIQHVYDKYDRRHTAQVANVVSYRPRSAVRDIAKAFGYSPGQQDAWSKQIDRWGHSATNQTTADTEDIPRHVIEFANQLQTFPRHLGIHSGGMVICDRPIVDVCPVEWARMPKRTVLQWDKDDCASVGLVKFDLLGLGMLSALHYAFDMIESTLALDDMPLEDAEVYAMLCRADSVGVFQVESRAQMATLPRLKPDKFYDLVIEVALIRPGPIQGGSVHPYIRRKNGVEEISYPHKNLEKTLERTLGVPLFQEQLMQMAIDVAGFTPAESDELRRAMGSKRSMEKMTKVRERLYTGMAANGITGTLADDLYTKLAAFANYGFPESHAMSFAYLVFASAWLKRYHPAAFCAALLNAQPMGFYSPQSLVDDARRHGVAVRRPDVNASNAAATLEPAEHDGGPRNGPGEPWQYWGIGGPVVRLGLKSVRTLGTDVAERIEAERAANGPYLGMADLSRRAALSTAHLEALATADAFACFGLTRREALWGAGAAAQERSGRLPGTATGITAPTLPGMTPVEDLMADVWATGLAPDAHPVQFVRGHLTAGGVLPVSALSTVEHGRRVHVGGIVTHRQRPATAGGVTFINLEDETGMLNVTCTPGLWQRFRRVVRLSNALVVRGILENVEGVLNLRADHVASLAMPTRSSSRDFR